MIINNNFDNSNLFFNCWRNNYIKYNILNQLPSKYLKIKKYSEIHSIDMMLKSKLYGLIEDKVKMNQYLTFGKTFKLINLFNIIKDNETFYKNLLNFYKAHFIHLNEVCEEACIADNISALKIFLNDENFKSQKSLIDICIREGNLNILKYLFQNQESIKEFSKKELLNNIFEERELKNFNKILNYLLNELNIDFSECIPYQFDVSIYLKIDLVLFDLLYSKGLIIVDQNSLSLKYMDNIFECNGKILKKYIQFLLFILNNKFNINVDNLIYKINNLKISEQELEIKLSNFDESNLEIKKLIEILIFDIQEICSFRFQLNHNYNELHYAIKYNDIIFLRNLNQKVKQKGIDLTIEYGNSEALLEITSSQIIINNSIINNNNNNIPILFKYCKCREKQRIYLQTFLYHVNCQSEKDYIFKLALIYDDLEIIQFIHHLMLIYGVYSNKPKKIISSDFCQYIQSVKVLTYLCQNKKDFNFNYLTLLKKERFDLLECFEQFSIISKKDTSLLNQVDLSLNAIKYLNEKGYSCTYKAYYNSRKSIEKYKYLVDNRLEKYSFSDIANNQNSWILLNYIYDKRKEDIISKRFDIDYNFFDENVIFLYYSNNHDKMFNIISSNMDLSPIVLKEFAKRNDLISIDKFMTLYFPNENCINYKHHLIHLLESATKSGHIDIFKLLYTKYSFIFKGVKSNSIKLNCLHESRLLELTLIAMEYNYLDLFFYFIDIIKLIPNQFQILLQLRLRPSNSIKYHYLKKYHNNINNV